MITYNNTRGITTKWPGMIIVGDNVTPEQAAEILLRTDENLPDFQYAGNDKKYAAKVQEIFGPTPSYEDENYDEVFATRLKKYKKLDLGYLGNSRIISCYVGGPYGWCDWDGTIGSSETNIGKWPSVAEVAEDWGNIAEAFPFLNLRCQLFTGETCEEDAEPNLIFIVKDGNVVVEDSDTPIGTFTHLDFDVILAERWDTFDSEHGITIEELKEKVRMVYGES